MARPVELCLVLEGEDAIRFEKYLNDPDDITPEGRELLRKAKKIAEERLAKLDS
jgi:hypothetical protein